MEVYYRKYANTFKYRFRRYLEDRKFKKKRKLQNKNKPKPTYTPPKRTPEEQREIDLEMKRLYREYHVSVFEKLKRARAERKRMRNELAESIGKKKKN
jgi:ribosome-binding protein aMBF1 (putative translation factor)